MQVITVDGCEKMVVLENGWAYEITPLSKTRTGHCWEVKSGSVRVWSNSECTNIIVRVEER